MIFSVTSRGVDVGAPSFWDDPHGVPFRVPHPPQHQAIYFFIDVAKLRFPEGTFLEGLNVWPGAEWHFDRAVKQSPVHYGVDDKPDRVNRVQVWRRDRGEKLVIVDQYGGIRILSYNGGWTLTTPTPQEVATYFYEVGMAAAQVRAIDFALHNLRRTIEGFGLPASGMLVTLQRHRTTQA